MKRVIIFLTIALCAVSIGAEGQSQISPPVVFTRDLKLGSRGDDVRNLQKFLNGAGFTVAQEGAGAPGRESDYFGSRTMRALKGWQFANGVPATGYFGPISRGKYIEFIVFETINQGRPASSSPSSTPAKNAPVVEKVFPLEAKGGEIVTISGSGFTRTGNTVLLWYGALQQKIENVSSPDGKTLVFVFSPPEVSLLTKEKINSLPPDVQSGLTRSLEAQGRSPEDLTKSYAGISSMADLEFALKAQGRSLDDLKDPYRVIVRNARGESDANAPVVVKGIRSFPFAP